MLHIGYQHFTQSLVGFLPHQHQRNYLNTNKLHFTPLLIRTVILTGQLKLHEIVCEIYK